MAYGCFFLGAPHQGAPFSETALFFISTRCLDKNGSGGGVVSIMSDEIVLWVLANESLKGKDFLDAAEGKFGVDSLGASTACIERARLLYGLQRKKCFNCRRPFTPKKPFKIFCTERCQTRWDYYSHRVKRRKQKADSRKRVAARSKDII